MTSRQGSTHSRSSSHSRDSLVGVGSDDEDDQHDQLFERALAANRSRRSQRSSASLHDLEVMQAIESNTNLAAALESRPSDTAMSFAEESEVSTQTRRATNTTIGGTLTSSAHLRFVLEEDDATGGGAAGGGAGGAGGAAESNLDASGISHHSATSAYSEYSEYEEDEFDPEWHARQNQQAAMALLGKSGPRQTFGTGGGGRAGTVATTEKTRSIMTDLESVSEAPSDSIGSQLFAHHRDLREEVDQSVNLMDASVGNYDDPREYGEIPLRGGSGRRQQPRRGKKQPARRDSLTGNFLAAAQNSLVDVFLDTSEGKMPSFRRSMSRNSGGSGSLRLQASAASAASGAGSHQRRLFYGHSPPPPPTIREGRYYWCGELFTLENCCKLTIVLFVMVFMIILALPQGTWWIQEKLGLINDKGEPLLPTGTGTSPSLPLPTPPLFISDEDARLAALHKIILTHELTSKDDLLNKDTPQYHASKWLARVDPANLTLIRTDDFDGGKVEPHKVLNRYVMATFYLAMNGPRRDVDNNNHILWNETHWHDNEDWMSGKHICEWYGIECEGQNHIEHFNLTSNWLKGSLPSELRLLTDLILVDWSHNEMTGPIPEFVGDRWLDLEYLFLDNNPFQGTLPPSIGNLTNLQELVFSHTGLKGSIPPEMNRLTQLRVLKLDHNDLDGSIPPLEGLAPSLEVLTFYANLLTGFLPPSLFQLTNLVELELDHNYLKGTIAPEIGAFHNLEAFTISNNQITGLLPDVWNQTPNLVDFQIDNNHIRGIIPSSLAALTDLEYLTLDDNPLTGTIPSELGNLESLVVFQAYHTELVGSMPQEICSLELRRGIDLIVFGDCENGRFDCQCCDRCF